MQEASEKTALGWKKKLLFYSAVLIVTLLAIELAFRAVFAFKVGPSVFLYGTRFHWKAIEQKSNQTVAWHHNKFENYSKYFPHQSRVTNDKKTGQRIPVTINSTGFRGKEFTATKDANTVRIVTLGASSTFGYYNRDDETYPYYTEKLLNRDRPNSKTYEVINLGIPHLNSSQILSLFLAEALPLNPDVVTFYEGNNDAWFIRSHVMEQVRGRSFLHRGINYAGRYLMVFATAGNLLLRQFKGYTKEHLDQYSEAVSEKFLANLSMIDRDCKKRNIRFIVATHQKTSSMGQRDLAGVTYKQEIDEVKKKLAKTGYIAASPIDFLLHDILMRDMVKWASAHNVALVDIIKAMD